MKSSKGKGAKGAKFERAPGAPFADEDTPLVARELAKIASASKQHPGDVRSLDPTEVYEIVRADPTHPLRKLYGDFQDVDSAARSHWINLTKAIIRGVRVVYAQVSGPKRIEPMFVSADVAMPTASGGKRMQRRRVMREDALRNDPIFASTVGSAIRRIEDAVRYLEHLTAERAPDESTNLLKRDLRDSLDSHKSRCCASAAQ